MTETKKKVIRVRHQKRPLSLLKLAWGMLIAVTVAGVGISFFPVTLLREDVLNPFHKKEMVSFAEKTSHFFGFDRYKKPEPPSNNKRKIALVVSDVGLQKSVTEKAVALHGSVTLSFSPYGEGLAGLMESLWKSGHELLITLPLQPLSENADRGPLTLAAEQTLDINMQNLGKLLESGRSFIGALAVEESQFMRFVPQVIEFLKVLRAGNLVFVDACSEYHTEIKALSKKAQVSYNNATFLLSSDLSPLLIEEKLKSLEAAPSDTIPIVVVQATDLLVTKMGAWLRNHAKTVDVVPLSLVFERKKSDDLP